MRHRDISLARGALSHWGGGGDAAASRHLAVGAGGASGLLLLLQQEPPSAASILLQQLPASSLPLGLATGLLWRCLCCLPLALALARRLVLGHIACNGHHGGTSPLADCLALVISIVAIQAVWAAAVLACSSRSAGDGVGCNGH